MPCRKWLSYTSRWFVWTVVFAAGCTQEEFKAPPESWDGVCIDKDEDGFGFQCEAGPDCNDDDPAYNVSCPSCSRPDEGCECVADARPVDCTISVELSERGALLCKVGTRYCRDGMWGACEGITEFEAPAPSKLRVRAAIDQNAVHPICDACNPDCYQVRDEFLDGGAPRTPVNADGSIVVGSGGGITLYKDPEIAYDAGYIPELLDDVVCNPGTAPDWDCDGIPDDIDPYPLKPPFPTDHRTIFMELMPGTSGTQAFEVEFYLNSADIYFYLDMTASMDGERDKLISSLRTGNYLSNKTTECADRDFDGTPNNELRDQGIAGNIACLIRDSNFGAGWFRDIPFVGPYASPNGGIKVADDTFEMYENRQDITSDTDAVRTALQGFKTSGNQNVPEGSMQGLWAIATGLEVYAGWNRPGIPKRLGCPEGTWGYPCFRDGATPIVIHITDAPLQNGPSPTTSSRANYLEDKSGSSRHPLNYDSNVLSGTKFGTDPTYRPLTVAAEKTTNAQDVGTLTTNTLVTYFGNTEKMTADHTYTGTNPLGSCVDVCIKSFFGICTERRTENAWASNSTARDAVFKFTTTTATELTVSTRGSHFDTSLLVVNAADNTKTWCHDDISSSEKNAEIKATFPQGTYYAVLKGQATSANGWFQITFGNTSKATTGQFAAKRWEGTGGVKEKLLATKIRVISVNSSDDKYLAEQTAVLSSVTGGVDRDGKPLVFTINTNGSGMGESIIEAVELLAGNLSMDVGVKLKEAPDKPPAPGFGFKVEAVDTPGDGCEPPIDTDKDPERVPDTHVKCRPGAVPRFSVTFSNPLAHPVPDNTGAYPGYNMSLQLVGDGRYLISEVPVYIVPRRISPEPPVPKYAENGSYEQRVRVNGCLEGEGAIWRSLDWTSTVPAGTRVLWQMCGGNTDAQLTACQLKDVAEITSGAACMTHADCGGGYCSSDKVCHYVLGPACNVDVEGACGKDSFCNVSGRCQWTSAGRADLLPAAQTHTLQARPMVRVKATLFADAERLKAPTIHTWRVDYRCVSQE